MQRYGLLLSDQGTIRDDFMFARLMDEPGLFLVVNAATKDEDFAYIAAKLDGAAVVEPQTDRALLALQGPMAETVLKRHVPGVEKLTFMKIARFDIGGAGAIISRSGYTGEDGFEISVHAKDAEGVAQRLLSDPEVLPIGLGARDSLRLEAGLCLYGHDMDDETDPITANLAWSIGKRRRLAKDFPAGEAIMDKLAKGPETKRVGILPDGRAPAREGTEITDKSGRVIGRITSGGFGPTLNAPVAMGYVENAFAKDGTEVNLMVRGNPLPARVAPMPFVAHCYKR
jgi:aminomethyltransferase